MQRRTAAGPASGDMNDGKWSGESSRKGGFRMDDQQVRNSIKGLLILTDPKFKKFKGFKGTVLNWAYPSFNRGEGHFLLRRQFL